MVRIEDQRIRELLETALSEWNCDVLSMHDEGTEEPKRIGR